MKYPSYRYPVDALSAGASLGNYFTFARLTRETNVCGLWSALDDQWYLGEWNVQIDANGLPLPPIETHFAPESQTTMCGDGRITAAKQFFVVYSPDRNILVQPSVLQAGCYIVRCANPTSAEVPFTIRHVLHIPAKDCPEFTKKPPEDQQEKKVRNMLRNDRCMMGTEPDEARVFGSAVEGMEYVLLPDGCEGEFRFTLQPGESRVVPFIFSYSPHGIGEAEAVFEACRDAERLLEASRKAYREILSRAEVCTPDPLLNRGVQWAKVNMVRVQHRYRAGEAFTNDPPQDIVVIRDLAWYVLGADYLTPDFSRNILELAARCAYHPGGKLTEYLHANEARPALYDYRLNINDDTPLYVYALYHHALTAGDDLSVHHVFSLVKRACDYILSQIERGLVRCTARGVNVWGICGWRNIIDGYTLSGAVTEINVECYHALVCCSLLASRLGNISDANFYRQEANRLRDAIETMLRSRETGLYLLNIDTADTQHHDITGDLIFPVMFDVAAGATRKEILARLTDEEMWTRHGSRTVSPREKNYDPDFGYQLMGGLWHNLTAWVAYCIRNDNPAKLVEGMQNIFRYCEPERPVDWGNVVPGEFPERLHGEDHTSRGMAMSPWMPPTYLWLAIEGLLGVAPQAEGVSMTPALPKDWSWIAVRNLPFHGGSITAFIHDGTLYATQPVESNYPVRVGSLIHSEADSGEIYTIAMEIDGAVFLFVASETGARGVVTIDRGEGKIYQDVELREGEAMLKSIKTSVR